VGFILFFMKENNGSPLGEQLLTDSSVAEKFAVSVRTVIDWRNAGKLPFIRCGRSIRYRPESIAALLEKLEIGGAR
jgi:Helix-turn-helix domain